MNYSEKFIDKNIADLAKSYDQIHGANVNIMRSIANFIDGLKPVQRRALYTMFLKDGGNKFRKLATISGDTFGKFHPHCISYHSEIILTNGTKMKIGEMDQDKIYEVLSVNEFDNIVYGKMYNVHITKYTDTICRIKFTNGHIMESTVDHQFLTFEKNKKHTQVSTKWVEAESLKSGDVMFSGELLNNNDYIKLPDIESLKEEFVNNEKNKFILVEYIEIIKLDKEIPMYDFTVDHYHNALIHAGSRSDNNHSFIVAHNSPESINNSLVLIAQEWNNLIPMVEGSGNFGSCFDSKTEVLTIDGWKYFKDIKENEILASVNIENKTLTYERINKLISFHYQGDMINYEDEFTNFSVTPDHDMVILKKDKYIKIKADKLSTNLLLSDFYQRVDEDEKRFEASLYKDNFIPKYIYTSDHSNIRNFIESFVLANTGEVINWNSNEIKLNDKSVAEKLQLLLLHMGLLSYIQKYSFKVIGRIPGTVEDVTKYKLILYNIQLIRKENIKREYYDGMVYCAEVPNNHTLITKRNGKIMLSGNCAGDPAGASRYIQARLSDYSKACFFENWKDSVVDMSLAYDEENMEPDYLPSKYPNILINGIKGVGYGEGTALPSYNFREVVEATIALMNNPNINIVLIPDSSTGADIIEMDFAKLCEKGRGSYIQRCVYEIDPEENKIIIKNLPNNVTSNIIRERIADIKEKGGLSELTTLNDLSGKNINMQLILRNDINPYKFIKKLIKSVQGLESSFPVNITVVNEYKVVNYSIKDLLLEWIKWRREQVRVVTFNKKSRLFSDQRINDIKIFILNKDNLDETIKIFRHSKNIEDIQENLLKRYKDTPVRMDSVQAKTLSNMRFHELSIESYEKCLKRQEELIQEIEDIDNALNNPKGIDKIIIAELRDGIKRFGQDRRSNVIPYEINSHSDHHGYCIFQLNSDGMIIRKAATNMEEEPIPVDSNGYAVLVDNESSFILIDDTGHYSFIKAKDVPLDVELPASRYMKKALSGNIIAMLPGESEKCCTLVSEKGIIKRIIISDLIPSKKPCISLDKDDKLVKGIVLPSNSNKDLLIYTKKGYGQRLENNSIRVTSPSAKGSEGFKLKSGDSIIGLFAINPDENDYLLYTTLKGKQRLNNLDYLPIRKNKHDDMVSLITLSDRDRLFSVLGCNKLDKLNIFFTDGSSENISLNKIKESTMSELPKKYINKDMTSEKIVKVKLI